MERRFGKRVMETTEEDRGGRGASVRIGKALGS